MTGARHFSSNVLMFSVLDYEIEHCINTAAVLGFNDHKRELTTRTGIIPHPKNILLYIGYCAFSNLLFAG